MTFISPGDGLSVEDAAELAAKYGTGAVRRGAAAGGGARAFPHRTPPERHPARAVERFLSSFQDYEDAIPGLAPGPGGGGGEAAAGGGAPAALLRALARAPALAPPLCDGNAVLAAVEASQLLPTGVDAVDFLLNMGLRQGMVYEVAGETAAGKSQLCMQAAAMRALHGERVLYLDTTNAFSAARTGALAGAQRAAMAREGAPEVRARARGLRRTGVGGPPSTAARAGPGAGGRALARVPTHARAAHHPQAADLLDVPSALDNISVVRPHSAAALLSCLDELSLHLGRVRRERRRGRRLRAFCRGSGAPGLGRRALSCRGPWGASAHGVACARLPAPAGARASLPAGNRLSLGGAGARRGAAAAPARCVRCGGPTTAAALCACVHPRHALQPRTALLPTPAGTAGQVLVGAVASMLRHIADAFSVAVLVTNHVVTAGGGFGGGGFKPALGGQWRAAPHARLQLSRGSAAARADGGVLVVATLTGHPSRVGCAPRVARCHARAAPFRPCARVQVRPTAA